MADAAPTGPSVAAPSAAPAAALPRPPRPVPQWWRDAAGAATWLSVLVVIALWLAGGGLSAVHSARRGAHVARAGDRAGRLRPAARPGAADGAHPAGRAQLRPGRAGPAPPLGRLRVVQPDGAARRGDHPGLRGHVAGRALGHHRRLRPQLPGHAARRRRHGRPLRGRRHLDAGGPPPAALRVLAPDPPLRLPRRRAGAAAPAVDRAGVPHLAGRHRLLVGPVRRRAGQRPGLAGRPAGLPQPAARPRGHGRPGRRTTA